MNYKTTISLLFNLKLLLWLSLILILISPLLIINAKSQLQSSSSLEQEKNQQQQIIQIQRTNSVPINNDNNQVPTISDLCNQQLITKSTNEIVASNYDCKQLNFCDDRAGFEAILYIHRQLDEDANGDIDLTESDEFIRDELKYENGDERQRAFHRNDKHITVDELWQQWLQSTIHNWTVDQTIEWLTDIVELPQYQNVFEINAIDGVALPRLAAANQQLLTQLGINNSIHKQKIALKAMDIILFGEPKSKNFKKDLLMAFLSLFAIIVGYYAYRQNKYSREHFKKMSKDIETLSEYEKQIQLMQYEMDKLKQEKQETSKEKEEMERKLRANEKIKFNNNGGDYFDITSTTSDKSDDRMMKELEEKLFTTQQELKRYQQSIENRQWLPPIELQSLLQLTYELENRYYNLKKNNAQLQIQAARDGCDKLKRKRLTFLGAFRIAHGSQIDNVDNTILQTRMLLTELTEEMRERCERWKQIESFCNFEIIHNPGISQLEKHLYGTNVFTNESLNPLKTSTSTSSMAALRRGSEAIVEEDTIIPAQAKPSLHSLHQQRQAAQAIEKWQYSSNLMKKPTTTLQKINDDIISSDNSIQNNYDEFDGYNRSSFNPNSINRKISLTSKSLSSTKTIQNNKSEENLNDETINNDNEDKQRNSNKSFDTCSTTSAYYDQKTSNDSSDNESMNNDDDDSNEFSINSNNNNGNGNHLQSSSSNSFNGNDLIIDNNNYDNDKITNESQNDGDGRKKKKLTSKTNAEKQKRGLLKKIKNLKKNFR